MLVGGEDEFDDEELELEEDEYEDDWLEVIEIIEVIEAGGEDRVAERIEVEDEFEACDAADGRVSADAS
jgi:hypothetical protein